MTAQVVKMSPRSLPFREVRQRPLDEEVPFVCGVSLGPLASEETEGASFTRFGVSSSLLIIVAGGMVEGVEGVVE